MSEEERNPIEEIVEEVKESTGSRGGLPGLQGYNQAYEDKPNIIQLQIETAEMLERLEHFYRGDKQGYDGDGNYGWVSPKGKGANERITLNEYGVSSLMEIVTKYIDKNTILSDYPEDRIYEILGDLGDEIVLFLLCNYEKIGMDTYYKKTKFRLIITTTLHIIEATYRRALHGKTLEEMNQSRVISQSDQLNQKMPQQTSKKKGMFSWLGL